MNQTTESTGSCKLMDNGCPCGALFRCFRIAIGPGKMIPALLMVVLLYISGRVLDGLGFGEAVWPGEIETYNKVDSAEQFDQWRAEQRSNNAQQLLAELRLVVGMNAAEAQRLIYQDRDGGRSAEAATLPPLRADRWRQTSHAVRDYFTKRIRQAKLTHGKDPQARKQALDLLRTAQSEAERRLKELRPRGVFDATLHYKLTKFREIMLKAVDPAIITDPQARRQLVEPIVDLFTLPVWLWHAHPVFLVIWMILWLAVWSVLGGTISRMAVMEAARNEHLGFSEALGFVGKRWVSYVAAPVLPLVLFGLFAAVLAVVGVVGFQWLGSVPVLGWLTDILLAFMFCGALALGFLMALLLIGYAFGVHLMYPALSAEGSDAFDAISRSYSYIFTRPWRLLGYGAISLIYGAVTYLFIGAVIFLTLYLTHVAVGCFNGGLPGPRFAWMISQPRFGQLAFESNLDQLNQSGVIAAFLIRAWVYLTIGLVAAYAISYYFAATSTIYLLLRRHCDGTDWGQCCVDAPSPAAGDNLSVGLDPPADGSTSESADLPGPDSPPSPDPPAPADES